MLECVWQGKHGGDGQKSFRDQLSRCCLENGLTSKGGMMLCLLTRVSLGTERGLLGSTSTVLWDSNS